MGDVGHKMLGKELKSRENRQKRLKSIGKTMRQLFGYSVVIFAPPHADTAELAFCAIMGIIRIEILGGEECVWSIR